MRSQAPPGARQVEKDGKLWPPFPRPVGEKQHWVHKYHHAHYWPHPYNCDDEAYVRNIFDQQSNGGWIGATTLRDYHFETDTHQLNSVGRDQLFWILTSVPGQYRTVYVAQSSAAATDALRQANVEKTIREHQPASTVPVLLRYERYQGRPAQEIDQLRTLELQSIPRPRLFIVGSAGRGGSGGGSAAGGGSSGGGMSSQGGSGGGTVR